MADSALQNTEVKKRGSAHTGKAAKEEYPPKACAEIVFGFHDNGVKNADGQEGAKT